MPRSESQLALSVFDTATRPQQVILVTHHDLVFLFSKESLTVDQRVTRLERVPSFLEVAGYSFYFGGFLVGPQVRTFITP